MPKQRIIPGLSDRKNRESWYERTGRNPTDKQMALIEEITTYLGVDFDGYTFMEASEFIGEYLPELKRVKKKRW